MLIIKRPTHDKIARERRKLKKYRKLYDRGEMTELDIHNAYMSWRNALMKDCNACTKTIRSMDALYEELFPVHEEYVKRKRQDIIDEIRKENADEIRRCKRERAFPDPEGIYAI